MLRQVAGAPAGITPAWAGKSRATGHHGHRGQDHPRVGGEKIPRQSYKGTERGSPPRGRGKGIATGTMTTITRITPAWAGKSDQNGSGKARPEDHPRVGGEKALWAPARVSWKGSPPRGRGKGGYGWLMLTLTGITPAWAGKRALQFGAGYLTWDHPRVGGEKLSSNFIWLQYSGSPPRGRGKGPMIT